MKISKDWVLTELAGKYVAVPTGETSKFRGIIRLNESARDIWNALADGKTKEQIAAMLVENYEEVTIEQALLDVQKMIDLLEAEGVE